jgi:hypothetical protein
LFLATAAFAALVMIAPIGKAQAYSMQAYAQDPNEVAAMAKLNGGQAPVAADDSAVCYNGMSVVSAVYNRASANVKGNNEFDRRMLVADMAGRMTAVRQALMDGGGQHIDLGMRGRTPAVSCDELVKRAIAYMIGDPDLLAATSLGPETEAERAAKEEAQRQGALKMQKDLADAAATHKPYGSKESCDYLKSYHLPTKPGACDD